MASHPSEIDRLRVEVEDLRHQNRHLKNVLFGAFLPPEEWGLCRSEIIVVQLLHTHRVVTRAMLEVALEAPWHGPDTDWDTVVSCHVSKARSKLRPFGYGIAVKRHVGWSLVRPAVGSDAGQGGVVAHDDENGAGATSRRVKSAVSASHGAAA